MSKKKTVKEIAAMFNVTTAGVRYWLSKGLPYETEKVIGIKPRKVIDPDDVVEFLNLTKR
jgi:hypothetical protein